jgi:hypothetical protein
VGSFGDGRRDPEPAEQRPARRTTVRPCLWGRVRLRRAGRGDDHGAPLGEARGQPGARPGGCALGLPCRSDRRAPLLPGNELGRGAAALVGAARRLARWPWDLGWNRRRHARRPARPAPAGREHPRLPRRSSARAAGRAGHRPHRQLLQPGAVRRSHEPALGARDRPCAPARRLRAVRDLPSHVPLRAAVEPRARGGARLAGSQRARSRTRALRAVCRGLLGLPDIRRAAARRPSPPHPRAAAELLRRDTAVRGRPGVVRRDPGGATAQVAAVAP